MTGRQVLPLPPCLGRRFPAEILCGLQGRGEPLYRSCSYLDFYIHFLALFTQSIGPLHSWPVAFEPYPRYTSLQQLEVPKPQQSSLESFFYISPFDPTHPTLVDSPTTGKRGVGRFFWTRVPPLPLPPTAGSFAPPPHTQEIGSPVSRIPVPLASGLTQQPVVNACTGVTPGPPSRCIGAFPSKGLDSSTLTNTSCKGGDWLRISL
jgi:hypothetical protein